MQHGKTSHFKGSAAEKGFCGASRVDCCLDVGAKKWARTAAASKTGRRPFSSANRVAGVVRARRPREGRAYVPGDLRRKAQVLAGSPGGRDAATRSGRKAGGRESQ